MLCTVSNLPNILNVFTPMNYAIYVLNDYYNQPVSSDEGLELFDCEGQLLENEEEDVGERSEDQDTITSCYYWRAKHHASSCY